MTTLLPAAMLAEEVEEIGAHRLLGDIQKIKAKARHLLSLINDVLDISKIEANKMEIYAETFAVAEMATDVASTVGSLMNARGLMELIIINIGLQAGVIEPGLFSILVLMAILTTLMATPLFGLVYRPAPAPESPDHGATVRGA